MNRFDQVLVILPIIIETYPDKSEAFHCSMAIRYVDLLEEILNGS